MDLGYEKHETNPRGPNEFQRGNILVTKKTGEVTNSFHMLQAVRGFDIISLMNRGIHPQTQEIERMQDMGKKVRLKWPDRVKQPGRPVRESRYAPFDMAAFGPQITRYELRERVVNRKAF